MRSMIFGFALFATLAGAQTVLDGNLDDALWQEVPIVKLVPAEAGVPVDGGGEMRMAIAVRYLYVGARLPERTGRFTARSLGRNPNWEEEDVFRVAIGADLVATDWIIQINPLGAYSVEKKEMAAPTDTFLAAARIGGAEWRVEIALPLHLLNTPALQTIRLRAERVRAQRPGMAEQRWRWPKQEPTAKISGPEPLVESAPDPVLRTVPLGNQETPIPVRRVPQVPRDSAWDQPQGRDVSMNVLLRNEPVRRRPRFPAQVKLLHEDHTLLFWRGAAPTELRRRGVLAAAAPVSLKATELTAIGPRPPRP